jgi:hypothetical protein
MAGSPEPTARQLRWYYPTYNPSKEQARKDIDDYLRRHGDIPDEPTSDSDVRSLVGYDRTAL